ncbi:V-type ATP synthase subunit A [Picrophilus oshimae]|uniref:A-type ATP synthase subunit A n=1 Tax=Picrophilus torridus (strain ATCC 700027 / DSM 9790 / JCM 10055 / NBRC 100828 / KAW 2/3) TaxID=1122961 RepID=A0A8G2FW98_PICTO|nr:V-type ATP synthase subunit A [Picrophilus oshimae]SMD30618.1 V/A-type H+-transporting ATPase subunit A [Picrophilus oshimae DSM 9789]
MSGSIYSVSGPVVIAQDIENAQMFDVVRVGELGLIGEIIRISGNKATIQVYEDTSGLRPGEKVYSTGKPLSVELGPGLLSSIYDGIQRPLDVIRAKTGDFIAKGVNIPPLNEEKLWDFKPLVNEGQQVKSNFIIGEVDETEIIKNKIMVPYGVEGTVKSIKSGKFKVSDTVAIIETRNGDYEIKLKQIWPVREARRVFHKFPPEIPLITGQRVIDAFFPVAKGGTVAVPGPFGSGKCVTGDTPVLLADGTVMSIEDIYNKSSGTVEYKNENETLIRLDEPLRLYSFYNGHVNESTSNYIYKGKSDSIIKIRTASGREVKVTPVHKLFRFVDDKIIETEARYLNTGDFIASIKRFNNKDENYLSGDESELLGLYASYGSIEDGILIDASIKDRFINLAMNIFKLKTINIEYKNGRVLIKNDGLKDFIARMISSGIPSEIMRSRTCATSFINGYLYGKLYHDDVIKLHDNEQNILKISYMLTGLGIIHSIRKNLIEIKAENMKILNSMENELIDNNETLLISNNADDDFDLYPDEIESIEILPGPFDVYDVTTPDFGSNFVGGYGAILLHNTVIQHQLSKWSDSDIVVYVGCGERGNEMTEILSTFPELMDPKTGKPIMQRTVLIANTSNMPVAAREASIYTGVTIAEYYRDMGYNVALMADSTSRWAEALREISGRLEEMPGEEGYPAYLGRRISEFYERSGNAQIIAEDQRTGSVTLIGAVSPPGGDLSDPVVQNTLRVTRVFWALDASLASRRHFPSINWLTSYSLYTNNLSKWYIENVGPDWPEIYKTMMDLLEKESELQEIVQLVGYDALPEKEKNVLDIAKMIREDFLQQNAFDDIDTYCSIKKQYMMLKIIKTVYEMQMNALNHGMKISQITSIPARSKISRMKEVSEQDFPAFYKNIIKEINDEYNSMIEVGGVNA